MARVIYGGGVSEFVGSIGGTTFQSNRSGFIARNLPQIRKKRTSLQTSQIQQFTYLSQYYRALNSLDQEEWQLFAETYDHTDYWNNTKVTTGLGWFIVINSLRLSAGDSITNVPLGYDLPTSIPTCTATITATEILLDCATPIGASGEYLYIWATSETKNNDFLQRKLLRLIKVLGADTALPLDLASDWESVFGGTVADKLYNPSNHIILALTKAETPVYIALPFSLVRT